MYRVTDTWIEPGLWGRTPISTVMIYGWSLSLPRLKFPFLVPFSCSYFSMDGHQNPQHTTTATSAFDSSSSSTITLLSGVVYILPICVSYCFCKTVSNICNKIYGTLFPILDLISINFWLQAGYGTFFWHFWNYGMCLKPFCEYSATNKLFLIKGGKKE